MRTSTESIVSFVLVLMAVSSLVSMISILRIDGIIHGDLYRYGLQFSYRWAIPYWTMTTLVFGMGWFNIIVAIAFQFYVLIYGRKETMGSETSIEPETKPTEKIEEYKEQATELSREPEKKLEGTQKVDEAASQREQTETTQTEGSEIETKETSPPATETKQEAPEKSEETPIPAKEPEAESQTVTEDTPQQVGTSAL